MSTRKAASALLDAWLDGGFEMNADESAQIALDAQVLDQVPGGVDAMAVIEAWLRDAAGRPAKERPR